MCGQQRVLVKMRMCSTQKSHVVYELQRTETPGPPEEMSKAPPLTRSRAAEKKSRLSIAGRDTSSPSVSSILHGMSSPSSDDTDKVSGPEKGIVVSVSVRCFIAYGVSAMKKYMKVALTSKCKKPKSKSSKKIAFDDYYMVSQV